MNFNCKIRLLSDCDLRYFFYMIIIIRIFFLNLNTSLIFKILFLSFDLSLAKKKNYIFFLKDDK